jgi:putative FmdB family regulatory protein
MPTYEYRCPSCEHAFELIQRMSDESGAECPECGAAAERVVSGGAGFLFRGDGFYITETRSKEYKEKAKADSQAGGPGGTDGSKPADASGGTSSKAEGSPKSGSEAGTD